MTIKGVFKQKFKFPNIAIDRFYIGIFLGILTSVTMYLFLTASREVLRVMFSQSEYFDLWVVSNKETWFYNLIFAFISSNLGQGICFKTWFEAPNRFFSNYYFNFKRKVIYNESMFFNVNFLNIFAKLSVVYAIWFGENYCYLNYNISSKFNFVWIILVVVMHLEQWKTIRKVYRKNSLKPFIVFTSSIIVISFLLSFINPIDFKSFNSKYLSKSVDYNYQLDKPVSKYGRIGMKVYLNTDMFFVYPKSAVNYDTVPLIVFESKEYTINDLPQIINESFSYIDFYYDSEDFLVHIHCDKLTKMKYIKQLKESLAKLGVKRISLAVTPENHIYPSRVYRYHGLESYLPDYSYFKENQSNEFATEKQEASLKIEIISDEIVKVNDSFIQIDNSQAYLKQLYNSKSFQELQLYCHNEVKYGTYIKVRDNLNEMIVYLKKLKQQELEAFIETPFNLMELMEKNNGQ